LKYMQNGSFQNQSLMRLTLFLTLIFLTGFWATNFAIYFSKMGLTPASVQNYYLGSEANYTLPKTYQSMLEVTHAHLPMMALVVLLLTHLLIFVPLLNEGSGWLTRFVNANFAWMKLVAFSMFQLILGFLMFSLAQFLWLGSDTKKGPVSKNGLPRHSKPKEKQQEVVQP